MKKTKTILYAAISVLAMAATSCSKEEGKNTGKEEETTVWTLELADPLDAEIILNDDQAESFEVRLNTDLPADRISVAPKENQDWCTASLSEDASAVTVTPGLNPTENDQRATFVISSTVDNVTPVEFTVIRRGTSTEYTVSIESDDLIFEEDEYMPGGYRISYTASAVSPGCITIKVSTNAARWYFADSNMAMDPDTYEPVEWYTVDRRSGRNGETMTITFEENQSAETRMTMFYFDVAPLEGDYPYSDVSVTVNQNAAPASYINLYDEDGTMLESGAEIRIEKDGGELHYTIEADGGINTTFVNTGTTEPAFDGENDWATGGQAVWDPTSFSVNIYTNDSGTERAVDLIISPAGSDTELFRLKLVQSGE